ncbi:MAG TPA: AAA family ATPase [Phytomonospora sp.]
MSSTPSDRIPVLWLYGPPGVGKTTVALEIRARLGAAAAFADIDQLGMCYPGRPGDPDRHRLKADALAAVLPGFRDAGASCVVVSGVVDPAAGILTGRLPGAAVTGCRLRVDSGELVRRFTARRGSDPGLVGEVLADADAYEAAGDVPCVDTTGLAPGEVAARVLDTIGDWPPEHRGVPATAAPAEPAGDERILWISGPVGVGKSTVGFSVYLKALAAGTTAAYIDVDQIGFGPAEAGDPRGHRLKAGNLAALWRVFRGAGARRLVVVGGVEDATAFKTYTERLPGGAVTLLRLHAGPETLAERIDTRGRGGGWAQPGDPLFGAPERVLRAAAASAAAEAESLERAGFGDFRIDTDGLSAEEAAEAVAVQTRWPG